jgi:hypothetical protein
VAPATPYDAKGLLLSAFFDGNPVVYLEHKALYRSARGPVPGGRYMVPIGAARLARPGRHASVITYGVGVLWALDAAEKMAADGVEIEVVDLRTLQPWDVESVLKLNRVTGFARCDALTTRFADKSAIIEDDEYTKFNQAMKTFVIDTVIPGLTEYEDVLITREESKIYKEIDKVLGQAMVETLELEEEVQGYEMVEVKERVKAIRKDDDDDKHKGHAHARAEREEAKPSATKADQGRQHSVTESGIIYDEGDAPEVAGEVVDSVDEMQADGTVVRTRTVRKPILKKTFALKRIGYKVIPYEDETDSRYSFTTENIVFVNKANPTYKAESTRGDEFLMRHVISIVAEAVAQEKHPEGKDALELQNRLVAEAIRIHDTNVLKR